MAKDKEAPKKQEPSVQNVRLTFMEPLLGSASANPELYREFLASKAPEEGMSEAEVKALPDIDEELSKGTTVFHRHRGDDSVVTDPRLTQLEGQPIIWDYQVALA